MRLNRGIALLELLVVIVLFTCAFVMMFGFYKRLPSEQDLMYRSAREDITLIKNALSAYGMDLGKSNPESLKPLELAGYLPRNLVDPWGAAYQYQYPGVYSLVDVWSRGPDGRDSGDDVVGWDLYGSYVR